MVLRGVPQVDLKHDFGTYRLLYVTEQCEVSHLFNLSSQYLAGSFAS